jgi:hypothetical protein
MRTRGALTAILLLTMTGSVAFVVVRSADSPRTDTASPARATTSRDRAVAPPDRATVPIRPARPRARVEVAAESAAEPVAGPEPQTSAGFFFDRGAPVEIRGGRQENVFDRAQKTVRARFLIAGHAVAGVTVNGATSDAEGRLDLKLDASYRGFLIAQQPDGVTFRITPPQDDAPSADLGDIVLRPAGTIEGVVVDESGKAVAGASVAMLSSELDCRTIETTLSDADGRFTIPRVGPYRYEISVRTAPPEGVKAEAFGGRVAAIESGARDVRVVARAMFPVKLRLLDDATGEPVSGPWLACEIRRPGDPLDASFHELHHSADHIRFFLDAPGFYEIDMRLGDYHRSMSGRLPVVELRADRENVVDVRLKPM